MTEGQKTEETKRKIIYFLVENRFKNAHSKMFCVVNSEKQSFVSHIFHKAYIKCITFAWLSHENQSVKDLGDDIEPKKIKR
jgi:hypothetical protein